MRTRRYDLPNQDAPAGTHGYSERRCIVNHGTGRLHAAWQEPDLSQTRLPRARAFLEHL